jgi:hypothetical protein
MFDDCMGAMGVVSFRKKTWGFYNPKKQRFKGVPQEGFKTFNIYK